VSNNIRPASRYFRDMRESNMDLKANVEFPLANKHAKLKIGGSFVKKERAFNERIIQYKPEPYAKGYNGDIDDYFGDQNLGLVGEPGSVVYGLIIQDQTTGGGTYHGREIVPAGYAMINWRIVKSLKLNAGARYEKTDLLVENLNASTARLNHHDILPAVNITKEFHDHTNLRFGYGRTLARPTFRELARFASFDFQGDFILIGNPSLTRTVIDNIDLRYEV